MRGRSVFSLLGAGAAVGPEATAVLTTGAAAGALSTFFELSTTFFEAFNLLAALAFLGLGASAGGVSAAGCPETLPRRAAARPACVSRSRLGITGCRSRFSCCGAAIIELSALGVGALSKIPFCGAADNGRRCITALSATRLASVIAAAVDAVGRPIGWYSYLLYPLPTRPLGSLDVTGTGADIPAVKPRYACCASACSVLSSGKYPLVSGITCGAFIGRSCCTASGPKNGPLFSCSPCIQAGGINAGRAVGSMFIGAEPACIPVGGTLIGSYPPVMFGTASPGAEVLGPAKGGGSSR